EAHQRPDHLTRRGRWSAKIAIGVSRGDRNPADGLILLIGKKTDRRAGTDALHHLALSAGTIMLPGFLRCPSPDHAPAMFRGTGRFKEGLEIPQVRRAHRRKRQNRSL